MKTYDDSWTGTPPAGTKRIAFQRMPGDAEAAAAIGAMPDHTPSPPTYAIGDFVSGTTFGKAWRGRIWHIEGDRISIEIDGGWLAVPVADITH